MNVCLFKFYLNKSNETLFVKIALKLDEKNGIEIIFKNINVKISSGI